MANGNQITRLHRLDTGCRHGILVVSGLSDVTCRNPHLRSCIKSVLPAPRDHTIITTTAHSNATASSNYKTRRIIKDPAWELKISHTNLQSTTLHKTQHSIDIPFFDTYSQSIHSPFNQSTLPFQKEYLARESSFVFHVCRYLLILIALHEFLIPHNSVCQFILAINDRLPLVSCPRIS